MKKIIIAFYLVSVILLSGCGSGGPACAETFFAMGTLCEIKIFKEGASRAECDALMRRMRDTINEIENTYSLYRKDSFLSRLNQAAKTGAALPADMSVIDFFKQCFAIEEKTEGYFTVTLGNHSWTRFSGRQEARHITLSDIGSRNILLDSDAGSITIRNPRTAVDMNAVVPGFAADVMCEILKNARAEGLVNLGGEVAAVGNKAYTVGIVHPRKDALAARIALYDESCSTSGDYEQFIVVGSKRISHIIDPRTGLPAENNVVSATVIAPQCLIADALSTAAMAAGYPKAFAIVRRFEGTELILITEEKGVLTLYATPKMLSRIVLLDRAITVRAVE